ncbi:MAG: hypothetical protein SCJ97_02145 [Bacillota bacterium]|nr:hypothetical protein [Bacillota bacterium]
MKTYKISELKAFTPENFNKKELQVTEQSKVLLIFFESGQAVDPCVMSRNTMFYIIEGEGFVKEVDIEEPVSEGSLVIIEPGLERQLVAKTEMVVLAVQYA